MSAASRARWIRPVHSASFLIFTPYTFSSNGLSLNIQSNKARLLMLTLPPSLPRENTPSLPGITDDFIAIHVKLRLIPIKQDFTNVIATNPLDDSIECFTNISITHQGYIATCHHGIAHTIVLYLVRQVDLSLRSPTHQTNVHHYAYLMIYSQQ